MLKLNKHTKTKPKPKPTLRPIFKNCSYVRAHHCAQLSYTTQHRTVLVIIGVDPKGCGVRTPQKFGYAVFYGSDLTKISLK